VEHKENGKKVEQQWLVATNINPAERASLFALEIKKFPNLQASEKATF
jgi:hypothetical protein